MPSSSLALLADRSMLHVFVSACARPACRVFHSPKSVRSERLPSSRVPSGVSRFFRPFALSHLGDVLQAYAPTCSPPLHVGRRTVAQGPCRKRKQRLLATCAAYRCGNMWRLASCDAQRVTSTSAEQRFQDWTEQISDQNKLLGMMQEEIRIRPLHV